MVAMKSMTKEPATPASASVSASATTPASAERHTMSGLPLKPVYRMSDVGDPEQQIGEPGRYPYTRGIHETMYRGKPWTMRMFAGFGTPADTNQRFHFLLEQGQTGLSTAFD